MAKSVPTILLLLAGLSMRCAAQNPNIFTANGSLSFKIPGATLTLSPDFSHTCPAASTATVQPSDLSALAASLQNQLVQSQSTVIGITSNVTSSVLLALIAQANSATSAAATVGSRVDLLSTTVAANAASALSVQSALSSALAAVALSAGTATAGLSTRVDASISTVSGRVDSVSSLVATLSNNVNMLSANLTSVVSSVQVTTQATLNGATAALTAVMLSAESRATASASAITAALAVNVSSLSTQQAAVVASTNAFQATMLSNFSSLQLSLQINNVSVRDSLITASTITVYDNIFLPTIQEISTRAALGTTLSTRATTIEASVATQASRATSLELRSNVTETLLAQALACLNSGRAVDGQGRCISVTIDLAMCTCPSTARLLDTCIAFHGQPAGINCAAGFTTAYVPYCKNGTWSAPFPNCSSIPVWLTQPSLYLYDIERGVKTIQLAANDTSTLTYTLDSGALPAGMTMSTAGLISGTPAGVNVPTSYNFAVKVTTASSISATRTFELTVFPPVKLTYSYTGFDQLWSVPVGLARFTIKLWGAGGACQEPDVSNGGGSGGFTSATLLTLSNTAFSIMVGQGGLSGASLNNGGGGAGGGLAGIFTGSSVILDTDRARAVAIAGGGGGESDNNNEFGGAGGGSSGASSAGAGSTGGTQSAPGGPLSPSSTTMRGRDCAPPSAGGGSLTSQYGFGGRSWANAVEVPNGGGGAGYYGGGSNNNPATFISGGGGSGYLNPANLVSGSTVVGAASGVPSTQALNDPDYPGNSISYGGRQTQVVGQNGFNAYVVLIY